MSDDLLQRVVSAIVASVDPGALDHALSRARAATPTPTPTPTATPTATATSSADLASRLLLVDILDDDILGARSGDRPYPLRLLLTHLGDTLGGKGFELACALNVFFRVEMDEEAKMRLGLETSRLYYRFAAEAGLEAALVGSASPLLASLLGGQLPRLRFESVDHQKVFDSSVHERAAGSDAASAAIRQAQSFLCRVSATGMVRARAAVRT